MSSANDKPLYTSPRKRIGHHNLRGLRNSMSYTLQALADALKCSKRTIQRWVTENGLRHQIYDGRHFFYGNEVRAFIRDSREHSKVPLTAEQFFCTGCRKAVVPVNIDDSRTTATIKVSRNDKVVEIVTRRGICPICSGTVCRSHSISHSR